MVRVSAKEDRGKDELLEAMLEKLPPEDLETKLPEEGVMKVAIVGRRNTGKSTLVNTLAQAERVIVSEVPGTTRDAIDVRFELDGKAFMAIDTPGFRRTKSISTDIDFYSTHRGQRASAGPTWCCCSSTPRSGSARSTSSFATTSPSSTSRASSWSTSGT